MGLGSDIFTVGLSGLAASQRALSTTAHNIANVNTAGYSRQRVELTTLPPRETTAGYLGAGVQVSDIARSYDQFITREVQLNTAVAADYRVQHELAAELDVLLGQPESGLGPVVQNFFNAIEDVSADPASLPARQLVLDQAQHLALRFQSIDSRLQQMHAGVEMRGRTTIDEINTLAVSIADLNRQIVSAGGITGQPNDLLDQRDELVRQLAERVAVTTVEQIDGALNVFIGSGQGLVMSDEARQLALVRREEDPTEVGVAFLTPGGASVDVTSRIHGGELGALLTFEQGMLAQAQRRLGQLALGVAEQVNVQHQLGMDLNGNIGGLFFTDVNAAELQTARAVADVSNTGSATFAVTVDSVGDLQNSNYRLSYDGAQYTLMRESDDSLIGTFAALPQTFAGEGFSIELTSGAVAAGDSFTLRPAAAATRQFDVMLPNGQSLALATPVRTGASPANQGDAQIGQAAVADLIGVPLADGITLTYDAGATQFVVSTPPGGTLAYDPATDDGETLTLGVPGFGEISFAMRGIPGDGDRFSIEENAGGVSDNTNALLISDLQNLRVLSGGSATFAESYSHTVSDVASRTRGLELSSASQAQLLSRAEDVRAGYSGVNLDEEAADLMRFQQAYQASARVLSAADDMFQSLLRAVGG